LKVRYRSRVYSSSRLPRLADFNRLSALPPSETTPLLRQQVAEAKRRLPKQIEVQQQKEKDEVLGKLKDLGNTVLGAFFDIFFSSSPLFSSIAFSLSLCFSSLSSLTSFSFFYPLLVSRLS
jgi:hypothetical protein